MSGAEVNAFSARGARFVAAAALSSLLAACWLLLFPGDGAGVRGPGAHGYSRSAIGHFGLIRLLRDLGEPVLQLRRVRDLDECGLLVLAEPRDLRRRDESRVATWLEQVPAMLLVLPKRSGEADPDQPAWLADSGLLAARDVDPLLTALGRWTEALPPRLVRTEHATGWRSRWSWPEPVLVGPCQLLAAGEGRLEPLLECDQGVLVGRLGDVCVLSDPDVIANHGLVRGANAELVVRLLRSLRGPGAIVFDETLHGDAMGPGIWQVAGQFPHVLVPAHLLLVVAAVLWAACGRFGAPVPAPPALVAGKRFLIDNVAALLRRGSHHGPSLRRYGRQRMRTTAEALHAPRGLSDELCADFVIARLGDAGRAQRLAQLLGRAGRDGSVRDAVATAREIRTLTEELLHAGR
ncbi:MAG: hypothetical protein KF830_02895 [Planctomycetes bacterium]|nr:hypothetical protein [Planctomycetota bacterium]